MNIIRYGLMALLFLTIVGCEATSKMTKEPASAPEAITSVNAKTETMMTKTGAFLEITLKVNDENRPAAAGVYVKYKEPFLTSIDGATSKELIMRGEDVQVLHGFKTEAQATAYLTTELFSKDIVGELGPLLDAKPEVRIYATAAPANAHASATGAFLQISLKVDGENRPAAGGVYSKYREPFLSQIDGATSKELIMRADDVQVLHGFKTEEQAKAYLTTGLFSKDIVGELGPLLTDNPEIRIYTVFKK